MAKSLSTRIAERAARKKPSRNAQNRATFLSLRGDVKQALDDGWPVKTIWETLHDEGKVSFSYQAFRGYVNRLILSPRASEEAALAQVEAEPSPPAKPPTGQVKAQQQSGTKAQKPNPAEPRKKESVGIPGFTFNPTPNKEDLF